MTNDCLSELVCGAALGDLSAEEVYEMNQLGAMEQDVFAAELAAASVIAAAVRGEALPAALRARIEAGANLPPQRPAAIPSTVVKPVVSRPKRDYWRSAGWLAAAACFTLALVFLLRPWTRPPPSLATARAELIATAHDAQVISWTATNDPSGKGTRGDVVWSNAAQRGYMRFSGLSQNDPAATQYQLWIFDAAQDEKYPIDGGVFDISSGGQVIVPIHAKINVTSPTLFAVTVEKPGGVVVSKRERIVVTAKVGT